jgi:hypothetical protein
MGEDGFQVSGMPSEDLPVTIEAFQRRRPDLHGTSADRDGRAPTED